MGWIYFAGGFFAGIVGTILLFLFWPSKPSKFISMGTFEIDDKELPK